MPPQFSARAVVLDISEELGRYIEQIKVFTPELQYSTIQEIFISALRCLHFSYSALRCAHFSQNMREAVESMMLEITTNFCANIQSKEDVVVLEIATRRFIDALHDQLNVIRAYDKDGELTYTLGGWVHAHCPFLIPITHIQNFSEALPIVINSQYEIPDNSFYWHPNRYLPNGYIKQGELPFDER